MIVKITRRETPFAMVNKAILEDTRLSWKAKGIMAYLLSRPDSWQVVSEDITNRSTDGRESVLAGMNELREFGYAHLKQDRDEKGLIGGKFWVVYEEPTPPCANTVPPKTGFSDCRENRTTVKPIVGKPASSNNKETKKELLKNRGTLEDLKSYAKEIGLLESDGEGCFDKWQGNGWKNDGKPIVDWKSTMRAWKRFGYMASQKEKLNGHKFSRNSKLSSEPAVLKSAPTREDYLNGRLQ